MCVEDLESENKNKRKHSRDHTISIQIGIPQQTPKSRLPICICNLDFGVCWGIPICIEIVWSLLCFLLFLFSDSRSSTHIYCSYIFSPIPFFFLPSEVLL